MKRRSKQNHTMSTRTTPENITAISPTEIFVFGSNKEGMHHGGAARFALNFGAVIGIGEGLCGNTYAVPTMGALEVTAEAVTRMIDTAISTPDLTYLVTAIGCGIAGYTPEEIAPMFKDAINFPNIHLPETFWKIIKNIPSGEFLVGTNGSIAHSGDII